MSGTSESGLVNEALPELIITADRAIDGQSGVPVQSDVAVAVGGAVVMAVGPRAELLTRWPGIPVDRHEGASILPGLIDCHAHLTFPGDGQWFEGPASAPQDVRWELARGNARAHLMSGVTTIRDIGSHADLRQLDLPSPHPRVLLYGPPLTRPLGHGHLLGGECIGVDGVAARARQNLDLGFDGIKMIASGGGTVGTVPHNPSFTAEELTAAASVAHDRGKVITAHSLSAEGVQRIMDAGIDGLEHVGFLGSDGNPALNPELADCVAASGIAVGATLAVNYRYIALVRAGDADPFEIDAQEARSASFLEHGARLWRAGARFVAATDSGWKFTRFGDIVIELERMVDAGMPTMDVVHAATAGAADYLRLDDVGRMRPGQRADLLVVNGDPIESIAALRSVAAVYLGGVSVR